MAKRKSKETPVEKLLRQMRDKRKREADKTEKNRIKTLVKGRNKKLKDEKKEAAKAVVTERKARKETFKALYAALDAEKGVYKKAEDERIKKARTEKNGRIKARLVEAKALAKVEKTEKKARIKQDTLNRKEKAKMIKERSKVEREMLKRRKQAKEKKAKMETELEKRRLDVEDRKKRKWDDQKLANLLIDSY
jgi:5-hydroxyisourate hydrolase-like protein (transthyretin family)